MTARATDEELANFIHWSEVYTTDKAFDTALQIAIELRDLRQLLATPWPEHLDEIQTRDTIGRDRLIVPLGGVGHVLHHETALALAAGIIRAALAVRGGQSK